MRSVIKEEYLERMKHIAYVGGKISLDLVWNSSASFKGDNSVITNADIEISRMVRNVLRDLLVTPEHLLIDEEDSTNGKYLNSSCLDKASYIWVIVPVDGTRSFSNRMPNFGILLGLLKDLKPWLGIVYFPMLRELFYSDGSQSFFVCDPFTEREKKMVLTPVKQNITRQSIFLCNDSFFEKFNWQPGECQIMNPACAVMTLCWPSIGRGCGAFFGANIWDFAGSWPIFLSGGLTLRSYETGGEITKIGVDLFKGSSKDPWKLREYYILSSKQNYAIIREKIIPRNHPVPLNIEK